MVRTLIAALALCLPTAAAAAQYAAETAQVVDATVELFDRMEAESGTEERPAIRLKIVPQPMSLDAASPALRPEYGPIRDLTGYRVTWYDTDRLIGTVDFVGTWGDGRHLICGYVSWDMTGGAPELSDMTADYLETGTLVRSGDDAAHIALIEANCAYGELEPNLELVRGR